MTDNEIIKALECCMGDSGTADCKICPNFKDFGECKENLDKCALDLINRQNAEIEKLREQIKKGDKIYEEAMLNAEAEKDNLKQVIERLKNDCITIELDEETLSKDFVAEVKKEINTIKSEAYREFALDLKCGVPQETGVIRCANVDDTLKKLLSNDMGRYDHYTDSFVNELTRNLTKNTPKPQSKHYIKQIN